MRKALIGLSSPTAYFYDPDQKYFKEQWDWNPILESPQGLITLFDELWFITRSLCPVSLRNEEYVRFLDEDSTYSSQVLEILNFYSENDFEAFLDTYPYLEEFIDFENFEYGSQFSKYSHVIKDVYGEKPGRNFPIDNHSHSLGIQDLAISGNSMRIELFALDNVIRDYLSVHNLELVTNQFNNHLIKLNPKNTLKNIKTSQGITIKRIPVVQLPNGPELNGIKKLRETNDIIDFRKKILQSSNLEDYPEIIDKIEYTFQKYRNDVLLKKLNESKIRNSISRNTLNFIIGKFILGYGQLKSIGEDSNTREMNWTSFIANLENHI